MVRDSCGTACFRKPSPPPARGLPILRCSLHDWALQQRGRPCSCPLGRGSLCGWSRGPACPGSLAPARRVAGAAASRPAVPPHLPWACLARPYLPLPVCLFFKKAPPSRGPFYLHYWGEERPRRAYLQGIFLILFFFSTSDLNPTKNSGPEVIHASKCEKYGMFLRAEAAPRSAKS